MYIVFEVSPVKKSKKNKKAKYFDSRVTDGQKQLEPSASNLSLERLLYNPRTKEPL